MSHSDSHPLSDHTITLPHNMGAPELNGAQYEVVNWWDIFYGKSWRDSNGNPAALRYAMRIGTKPDVPFDDEVIIGRVGMLGHLVHVSELP